METFSLGIAWNWEYDADFVAGTERACAEKNLTTYRIDPHSLSDALHRLRSEEIAFSAFLDRASDDDESFEPLVKLISRSTTRIFNPLQYVEHAKDKATMHLEFITNGLNVPYTIIISPYNKKKEIELSLSELSHLGRPFIIKPANTTGGGTGVVMGAESLKDILETRQHHKNDKYLLQETVRPALFGGHKAWFRVLYAFGKIIPCWWDDVTHIYRPLSADEEREFQLAGLRQATETIRKVCKLDFFSSEIAMDEKKKLVVVDYVNEVCDMRLQSRHVDGVPDSIVGRIQELITDETRKAIDSH